MDHQNLPPDDSHPDYAQLDALRTGEGTPHVIRHVHTCRECQNRLLTLNHIAAELTPPTAIPVPAIKEQEITRMIAAQAARIRQEQPPRSMRFPGWLLRAAAALILVTGAWFVVRQVFTSARSSVDNLQRSIGADIDGNGRVDIVDAYMLDRMLQNAAASAEDYDVNHDRKVDQQDVRAIASRAVAVKPEDA